MAPPSAPPPTPVRPPSPPRQTPSDKRRSGSSAPPRAALASAVRWGVLFGGVAVIVDLATLLIEQHAGAAPSETPSPLDIVDLILDAVLFSLAAASVYRETESVLLATLAGFLAGLVDGIVVGAAQSMAPGVAAGDVDPSQIVLSVVINNVVMGTVVGAVTAFVRHLTYKRSHPGG